MLQKDEPPAGLEHAQDLFEYGALVGHAAQHQRADDGVGAGALERQVFRPPLDEPRLQAELPRLSLDVAVRRGVGIDAEPAHAAVQERKVGAGTSADLDDGAGELAEQPAFALGHQRRIATVEALQQSGVDALIPAPAPSQWHNTNIVAHKAVGIDEAPVPASLRSAFAVLIAGGLLLQWALSRWAPASLQIGLSLLASAWLIRIARGRDSVRWDWVLVAPAGAALWGVFQLAFGASVYPWATEQAALDWFYRLVACLLALAWFKAKPDRERVLAGLLWFGFVLAVVATLQRFTAPGRVFWLFDCGVPSAMGPFVYYNQYAAFMETVLPLALAGVLERRERAWLYALMAAVMIASVAAAGSRAGTALLAMEAFAAPAIWRRGTGAPWRRLAPAAATVAALAVGLAAAMGWSPLLDKLARPDPWGERRHLTLASLEMLRDRPGFGFGLGTWPVAYPAYARFDDGLFDNQAHNDWAQWAAEGGLPLLLLMAALAAAVIRRAAASVEWIGPAAVLVHALVDYPFQQRPALGYYWFALAGLLAAGRHQ